MSRDEQPPKFVQIAAAGGDESDTVYALDECGRVWWYRRPFAEHHPKAGWVQLNDRVWTPK